jgi:hypothetical protein
VSLVRPDHAASIAVASALGGVRRESLTIFGARTEVYRYPVG